MSKAPKIPDAVFFEFIETGYDRPQTRHVYTERLRYLAKLCERPIFDVISDPETFYPVIKAKYPKPTSRQTMLIAILVAFRALDVKTRADLERAHEFWDGYHTDMRTMINMQYDSDQLTPAQEAKHTSIEEFKLKYLELSRKSDPHATRLSSQEFLWLSIVASGIPLKRADYGSFRIFRGRDPSIPQENYIVLSEPGSRAASYMVFSKFKTDKTYGRIIEAVPPRLCKDIEASLSRHPREYLFTNNRGAPYANNELFAQFVVRTSQRHFGRATGVTSLRHAYISQLDMHSNTEFLNDQARRMGHSMTMQRKYFQTPLR